MTKTIVAYCRTSTLECETGQTPLNQVDQIRRAGFNVDKTYIEEGVSGTKNGMTRPVFNKMFKELKKGDTLIVTEVSRVGRNVADVINLIEQFEKMGVDLIILQFGKTSLCDPFMRAMVQMSAVFASLEAKQISIRVTNALKRVKSEGKVLGTRLTVNPNTIKEIVDKLNNGATMLLLSLEYSLSMKTIGKYKREFANNPQALQEYEDKFYKQQEQINLKEK